MTREEMREILEQHLNAYRAWSYSALADRVERDRQNHDCLDHLEGVGRDGTPYQMEFNAFWDDRPFGDIRVCGDFSAEPQRRLLGFLPIFLPHVTADFIMTPDGNFVGEDGQVGEEAASGRRSGGSQ